MLKIYISFAAEDRRLVREIEKVTKPWVRQNLIEIWHKEALLGGGMEKAELLKQMQRADIILVCLSRDYLFADDLYEEMQNAIQLRKQSSKVVIPVLLRDLDLNETAFKGITPLPSSRVSLSSHKWSSQDEAFYVLSKELERVIHSTTEKKKTAKQSPPASLKLDKAKTYQVGLSFAGEDRSYVEQVADVLKEREVMVFYDAYEEASLWGKDLYQHLNSIYKNQCEYTIIFISKHYARKLWTQHELKAAQTRAFNENREYILPIRLDDTELPGFNETVLYLDGKSKKPHEIANLVWRKLQNE